MGDTVTLRGGAKMPKLGLGMWKAPKDVTSSVVYEAIKTGWRHLDCAADYGNEQEVGLGIKKALDEGICKREDLWITTKLWNTFHAKEHVQLACEKSLKDLGLTYLDLYLVHFPISLKFVPIEKRYPPEWTHDPDAAKPKMELADVPLRETWAAMEELKAKGLVKNIGVSNCNCIALMELMKETKDPPAVNQVELHPYLTQERLLKFCDMVGIHVTGYSPLGSPSYVTIGMAGANESVMEEPLIKQLAQKYNKSPAQIVLRWGLQRANCSIVPKTASVNRLKENLALFDFSLSEDDIKQISALNRNRRYNDPGSYTEREFSQYWPIFD
ncbi:unnamed protein product [Vitrella brassicaformis CCMP3155]|uniref:NADP-dependent oxidoreductase domain-containing protein n=2 Tax=Vitrella brassicaformis TaxID=1169539 RepID=A0A0G4E954_VITBC|nr:unnamed protein product [Vitrella brassicaformis CCMP3155]|mmetsp:Transcript_52872/g.132891  ORF Transcript_52872/g.132891 Transcript_52872/m.132891 type:complete len:328 (+) Transcript_52872:120-1103(+)|eukprot:CEL92451.1 unnamed protein product [Vitrella brassicaformis CCMP3155]